MFVLSILPFTATKAQAQTGFSLTSLNGGMVSSETLKGKVIVLAVAALWVPLSAEEAKGIKQLSSKYNAKDVEFFWVFIDSTNAKSKNYASDDQLRQFVKTSALTLNILRDADGVQMKRLGVTQVPAFVVLDKTGKRFGAPIEGINPEGDSTTKLDRQIVDAMK